MSIDKNTTETKVIIDLLNEDLRSGGDQTVIPADGTGVTLGGLTVIEGVSTSDDDNADSFTRNTKMSVVYTDGSKKKTYTLNYRRLNLSGFAKAKNTDIENKNKQNLVLRYTVSGSDFEEVYSTPFENNVKAYIKEQLDLPSDTNISIDYDFDKEDFATGKVVYTVKADENSKAFIGNISYQISDRASDVGVCKNSNNHYIFFKMDNKARLSVVQGLSEIAFPVDTTEVPEGFAKKGEVTDGTEFHSFYFHNNITKIGKDAFKEVVSKIHHIQWSNKLVEVGENAFANSGSEVTEELTLPESIERLGDNAFGKVSLINTSSVKSFTAVIKNKVVNQDGHLGVVKYTPTHDQGAADRNHDTYSEFTFSGHDDNSKFYFTSDMIGSSDFEDLIAAKSLNNVIVSKALAQVPGNFLDQAHIDGKLDLINVTELQERAFSHMVIERVDLYPQLTTVGSSAFDSSHVAKVYVDSEEEKTRLQPLLPNLASSEWHIRGEEASGPKQIDSQGLRYN